MFSTLGRMCGCGCCVMFSRYYGKNNLKNIKISSLTCTELFCCVRIMRDTNSIQCYLTDYLRNFEYKTFAFLIALVLSDILHYRDHRWYSCVGCINRWIALWLHSLRRGKEWHCLLTCCVWFDDVSI